jgi:hypothetical protein
MAVSQFACDLLAASRDFSSCVQLGHPSRDLLDHPHAVISVLGCAQVRRSMPVIATAALGGRA